MSKISSPTSFTLIKRPDRNYPPRLNDLYDPPACIYTNGNIDLLKVPMIAVVGSRLASPEGLKNAAVFSYALSQAGLLVVSGLARGIDGAAHEAALSSAPHHFTMAVCGAGLDVIYPKEHLGLAHSISQKGLLISEYPPGSPPNSCHFPRRNRIIAALALGVVVIEAAERSGSLITARLATDIGREVFAVPGSIQSTLSSGCNLLIQQGAKLVREPGDILEELIF